MIEEIINFRKGASKADKARDKGLKTPSSIERFDNIEYGSHHQKLDVYRPKNNGVLPVIVSIHGGGYCYGNKEVYQFYCMSLAQKGFAVINFNYRLMPRYHFPTPLIDTNEVLFWMVENKDKYQFDIHNVFIVGDSAGAQLASQYGTMYSSKEYAKIMEIRLPSFTLRGLGLNCGLYDIKGKITKHDHLKNDYFGDLKIKNLEEKRNVLSYIDKNYPPTYLISSPGDFLLPNFEPMMDYLKSKNAIVEGKIYGDKNTFHVFHCNIKDKFGMQANQDEIDFFKKYIV